jgi:hypothetical protein
MCDQLGKPQSWLWPCSLSNGVFPLSRTDQGHVFRGVAGGAKQGLAQLGTAYMILEPLDAMKPLDTVEVASMIECHPGSSPWSSVG